MITMFKLERHGLDEEMDEMGGAYLVFSTDKHTLRHAYAEF
jgi:hypothetical protein